MKQAQPGPNDGSMFAGAKATTFGFITALMVGPPLTFVSLYFIIPNYLPRLLGHHDARVMLIIPMSAAIGVITGLVLLFREKKPVHFLAGFTLGLITTVAVSFMLLNNLCPVDSAA